MIELAHIATGALATRRFESAFAAALVGVATHALMDVAPHGEVDDRSFEIGSTLAGLGAIAARHGVRSPLFWGAVGGVLPDAEHVLPARIKPQRDLFITHRVPWLHSSNGRLAIPAWLQVVAGGAVIGALVFGGRAARSEH